MFLRLLVLFLVLTVKITLSQDNKLQENITDKVVIGFPGVTQEQLNQLKVELNNIPQVEHAYFIFGDHNCLMLKVSSNGNIKTFYDLLKPFNGIYEATSRCYIKPYDVYDFIVQKAESTPVFQIKP